MVIFGTALLAACYLAGIWAGEAIAVLIGVKANVGGVGIAMVFLIAAQHFLKAKGLFPTETERGVTFWAMMYIPVVVAMAATQNVLVAVKGGPIALLAAIGSFLLCFCVVAFINRMIRHEPEGEELPDPLAADILESKPPGEERDMFELLEKAILDNPLITAFAFIGVVIWISNQIGRHLTGGRVAGSAIAVLAGLALAYWGGAVTGKAKGLADITQFSGLALMGGAMMRDFTIVATASEVHVDEAKKAGWLGVIALLIGTVLPFAVGVGVARAFGYTDPVALTTIGAGAVTYIVGPVTGAAIGATSDVMALSIATGVVKAILVMVFTPVFARFMLLKSPQSAMVFGGLAGTVSGVSAGLAATDRRLVPYGALVATFHTGIGCLLGPSLLFLAVKAIAW